MRHHLDAALAHVCTCSPPLSPACCTRLHQRTAQKAAEELNALTVQQDRSLITQYADGILRKASNMMRNTVGAWH